MYQTMTYDNDIDNARDRSTNRFSLIFNVTFCSVALTLIFIQKNESHRLEDTYFANKISKYEGLMTVQIFSNKNYIFEFSNEFPFRW